MTRWDFPLIKLIFIIFIKIFYCRKIWVLYLSCNYKYFNKFHDNFYNFALKPSFFILVIQFLMRFYLKLVGCMEYFHPSDNKTRLTLFPHSRLYPGVPSSSSLDPHNTNKRQTIAQLYRLLLMYGACLFKPLRQEREEKNSSLPRGREPRIAPPFFSTPANKRK